MCICESCYRKLLVYDMVIHNSERFLIPVSEIKEKYSNMDYPEIKKIVKESSWGRLRKSRKLKIEKIGEWAAFEGIDL